METNPKDMRCQPRLYDQGLLLQTRHARGSLDEGAVRVETFNNALRRTQVQDDIDVGIWKNTLARVDNDTFDFPDRFDSAREPRRPALRARPDTQRHLESSGC